MIDRAKSAARIAADIETLSGPDYTQSSESICRYAYSEVYGNTLDYFTAALEELGFVVSFDPVGTLVARNVAAGVPAFGIGSHCDSNRNGGRFDGTLGVCIALEVCRLNSELGLGLPLQLVAWLEEEGSGFGQMLLGSRIAAGRVTEAELKESIRELDTGLSFWEAAQSAGYRPEDWALCSATFDGLIGWIESHIEQARVLQDTGRKLGIVGAIAGYVHADVTVAGRADHAGATPMDFRLDPTLVLAECVLELERLARAAGKGTVATVGEIDLRPGLINAIGEELRFSLDIRGVDEGAFLGVFREISAFAQASAARHGTTAEVVERQRVPATPLDPGVCAALEQAAAASGEAYSEMFSGAAHDTMCVAPFVPSAMVFVPCRDGISHSPAEDASFDDAALATEVVLGAIQSLV
jgi:hydantoinase/carbamoylase family amidase